RLRRPPRSARAAEPNGCRLVLVANGEGAALAGEACEVAWNKQRPEAILSIGFCGALDPALGAGEVLVASRVEAPDGTLSVQARAPECERPHASGRLFSVDRVIQTVQEKRKLRALGGSAVEMEALAVGHRAAQWGVPFYCVRCVTDLAEEGFRLDFNAARAEDGRLLTSRIVWAAARRPAALVPELHQLYWRCRLAARILGDFLADCRF
ncbi:MAG: hypothetical protein M1541_12985, partial [Acidobacteria bacterium]|nr:hypothetical protein [Acidobacteriota bacterium]